MARLRIGGITAAASPRLRIGGVSASGALAAAPRLRVGGISASGAVALVVNPILDQVNVEPESVVSLTASLASGDAADSWAWRRIFGPDIGIVGTGSSVSFSAPSAIDGASVTVGVRATQAGVQSAEVTATIVVLPQTEWLWGGAGWIPHVETWS